jgi:Lipopolysaccharide kinase (Kdo/WaaP) family
MTVETAPPTQEVVSLMGEQARAAHFNELLVSADAYVAIATSVELHLDHPTEEAARRFLGTERLAGTNVYLAPDFTNLAESGGATFVRHQTRSGKRSTHEVFFGDMLFEDGTVLPVAVKPHQDDSLHSCATDYFTNEGARQMRLETFQSVGMVVGSDGTAYSLTVREPLVETLDSINWEYVARTEPDKLTTIWSQVARQAAMLHAPGRVSHGDLAARNIAMRQDGSIFFMDWEHAQLSALPARDAEIRYAHSRKDIGELMESLIRSRHDPFKGGIGLLAGHPEPWKAFRALVFDEYAATRLGFAAPAEQTDVKDELTELERSLKVHMAQLVHSQTSV